LIYQNDKLILTDCDGVILDWETHFHNWMHNLGHERMTAPVSYWQERQYPYLSQDEAKKHIYYFNTSAWMMGMPAFKDAQSGIAELVAAGYKFKAITAMGIDEYAIKCRQINLENLFGKGTFVDVIATDVNDSKKNELLKHKDSGLYWIEDRIDHCELGDSLGLNSLLMRHKHNETYSGNCRVVDSWADICNIIL